MDDYLFEEMLHKVQIAPTYTHFLVEALWIFRDNYMSANQAEMFNDASREWCERKGPIEMPVKSNNIVPFPKTKRPKRRYKTKGA